jgi:formiminotetrahydrofolate cyclodeaminase
MLFGSFLSCLDQMKFEVAKTHDRLKYVSSPKPKPGGGILGQLSDSGEAGTLAVRLEMNHPTDNE